MHYRTSDFELAFPGAHGVDKAHASLAARIEAKIASPAFTRMVRRTAFRDVAIWQGKAHANPPVERFGLVPLLSKSSSDLSLFNAGYRFSSGDARKENSWYLDAGRGIGLTYEGDICAISAAGVDALGNLCVVQLQGTSKGTGVPKGLQHGLRWRETFVNTWCTIGRQTGAKYAVVQAAMNSAYEGRVRPEQYDHVAQSLGFKQSSQTGNWRKKL